MGVRLDNVITEEAEQILHELYDRANKRKEKDAEHTSDFLTVTFDNSLKDEPVLCVARKCDGKICMLKMEIGEQADILYRLLTDQMAKAEIKTETE